MITPACRRGNRFYTGDLADLHPAQGHGGANVESLYPAVKYHNHCSPLAEARAQQEQDGDQCNQAAPMTKAPMATVCDFSLMVCPQWRPPLRVRNCRTTGCAL